MADPPPFQSEMPHPEGVPELRARRVGEIIDAAFRLYFSKWKTFIPVAAVFMVPYAALSAIGGGVAFSILGESEAFTDPDAVPTAGELAAFLVPLMVVGLLFLLIYPVMSAALSWAAGRTYLGENPSVGQIVGTAFRKIGPLLLVSILTGLAIFGGFLLLIIPALIFGIRFALAPQALILEGTKATEAMGRSWNLTRGFFWKVLGTILLMSLIGAIVQAVVSVPFQFASQFLLAENVVLGSILAFIGEGIGGTLITPFGLIVQVLLYFDLRIRKEGLDLSLMAQQLEQ